MIAAFLFLALAAPPDTAWQPFEFLVGEWIGEGGGQPGQASSGGFTFGFELDGKILVRRSFSEYAATKDRPAFRHDDLTVISRKAPGGPVRAVYYDNEGHVIEYAIEVADGGRKMVWVSAAEAGAPRYRFTYVRLEDGKLGLEFAIAPPGKPDEFATYVKATARRK